MDGSSPALLDVCPTRSWIWCHSLKSWIDPCGSLPTQNIPWNLGNLGHISPRLLPTPNTFPCLHFAASLTHLVSTSWPACIPSISWHIPFFHALEADPAQIFHSLICGTIPKSKPSSCQAWGDLCLRNAHSETLTEQTPQGEYFPEISWLVLNFSREKSCRWGLAGIF